MAWLIVLEQIVFTLLIGVLVIVDQAALEAEEVVEPVGVGAELFLVPEMPLANQRSTVAIVLQQLRQRASGRGQTLLAGGTARRAERHLDAESLLIAAADERGAGRRTVRRHVEVGQPRTVLRQAVDIRRLD